MTAFLPVSFVHWALTASSAVLRLAAANTRTSDPCASVGSLGAARSRAAVTPALAASNVRRDKVIAIACTPNQPADGGQEITVRRYIPPNITLACAGGAA